MLIYVFFLGHGQLMSIVDKKLHFWVYVNVHIIPYEVFYIVVTTFCSGGSSALKISHRSSELLLWKYRQY